MTTTKDKTPLRTYYTTHLCPICHYKVAHWLLRAHLIQHLRHGEGR
jgi:hypothetical protein